jgi:hypothetical protein
VVPWVDYNDVLGHPATRLFISHCGIHSIWEAAFHGVPVIGVPFQQEQAANAAKLASRGMGEVHKEAVAFRSAGHSLLYQRATMRELALKVSYTPHFRADANTLCPTQSRSTTACAELAACRALHHARPNTQDQTGSSPSACPGCTTCHCMLLNTACLTSLDGHHLHAPVPAHGVAASDLNPCVRCCCP